MRKKKKRFKGFLVLILLLGVGVTFFYIEKNDNVYSKNELTKKIGTLGYSEESTNKIIELDIVDNILNKEYSKTLNEAIEKNLFNKDCINSYFELENINEIYELCNLKYSNDEIKIIITKLDTTSIDKIDKYLSNLSKYSNYSNFIFDNYDKYNTFEETDIRKKISYVNIGLNNDFYENITESINTDNDLVLVNKYYKLDSNYINTMENIIIDCALRSDIKMEVKAKVAFEKLCNAAKEKGYTIKGSSGYRSYETQRIIYNNYVKTDNIKNVDTYSARAGHSEHQTGYAIDVSNGKVAYTNFGSTNDYEWAKDNIHKYGFIIRYKKDNQYITGYIDEPWHFRYVGISAATFLYENNLTLEEYLLNNKEKI